MIPFFWPSCTIVNKPFEVNNVKPMWVTCIEYDDTEYMWFHRWFLQLQTAFIPAGNHKYWLSCILDGTLEYNFVSVIKLLRVFTP